MEYILKAKRNVNLGEFVGRSKVRHSNSENISKYCEVEEMRAEWLFLRDREKLSLLWFRFADSHNSQDRPGQRCKLGTQSGSSLWVTGSRLGSPHSCHCCLRVPVSRELESAVDPALGPGQAGDIAHHPLTTDVPKERT